MISTSLAIVKNVWLAINFVTIIFCIILVNEKANFVAAANPFSLRKISENIKQRNVGFKTKKKASQTGNATWYINYDKNQ